MLSPICAVAAAGVTLIDTRLTAGTVTVAEADLPPDVAVMTAEPAATPVAIPVLDTTVATSGVFDNQTAAVVTSTTLPSEYVAWADKARVTPTGTTAVAGVTATDTRVAEVTFRVIALVLPNKLAVITADPLATPDAMPVTGETAATAGVADVQPANALTSRLEPSL